MQVKIEAKTLKPGVLGANGEDFVEISLSFENYQLITRNIATREYGGLLGRQYQATVVLRELHGLHNATLRAWLIRSDASTRKKPIYELFIVIYGMDSQKYAVGDTLDSAELFLQDPPDQVKGDQPVPYFNPHRLYNPALDSAMNRRPQRKMVEPAKVIKQQKALCDTDPLKQRVPKVMDPACGPQYFSASQQSPRVRTILKQRVHHVHLDCKI